ncbi:uncharacterized protein LOC133137337 [Conger conger]|uniref:uncharacterized protein LOC133137337 n=1 Tax=Conger conger TaxID=82655 RepID=UPI002A5ADDE9|nr:uncharacterized protein LOC133137337 [Conger conger]
MDTRNLSPGPPILLLHGVPQGPHLGPVTRSVAAGKPRPESRAPGLKRCRPKTRRCDRFSEKYRRLMEAMGRSEEEGLGAGGAGPRGGERGQEGPQNSPRHPDSYSVKFRTLMEVMGRSEEKTATPCGGNVAAATPATAEVEAANGGLGGAERGSDGRGEKEDPAPLQNEEQEEEEEQDNSAELDWMASMVDALIDGELHQSQVQEPEGVCLAPPTAPPVTVVDDELPGPITSERQSPGAWSGISATSDLDFSLLEDVLTRQQLTSPPVSLGQYLDLGLDPLGDVCLSEWLFLIDNNHQL